MTVQPWQLRPRIDSGGVVFNGWTSLSDPFVAEIMASQGWHSVTVDRQHGRPGPGDLWELALAISARGASPLVRVSQLDEGEIMQALDAGFEGIICPMINSADEARRLVGACRYPKAGLRSFGPTRAALGQDDYVAKANEQTLCFAMIETVEGVAHLTEILGVPGLDGIYVGPADLGLSYGRASMLDDSSEDVLQILGGLASETNAVGKLAGIHCASVDYARLMVSAGYKLVTIGSDVRFLRTMGEATSKAWLSAADIGD